MHLFFVLLLSLLAAAQAQRPNIKFTSPTDGACVTVSQVVNVAWTYTPGTIDDPYTTSVLVLAPSAQAQVSTTGFPTGSYINITSFNPTSTALVSGNNMFGYSTASLTPGMKYQFGFGFIDASNDQGVIALAFLPGPSFNIDTNGCASSSTTAATAASTSMTSAVPIVTASSTSTAAASSSSSSASSGTASSSSSRTGEAPTSAPDQHQTTISTSVMTTGTAPSTPSGGIAMPNVSIVPVAFAVGIISCLAIFL